MYTTDSHLIELLISTYETYPAFRAMVWIFSIMATGFVWGVWTAWKHPEKHIFKEQKTTPYVEELQRRIKEQQERKING